MEDSVTTPGCRWPQVAACRGGVCLVHWNLHERVERCDQEKPERSVSG
jgi:hypothetical protein